MEIGGTATPVTEHDDRIVRQLKAL